MSVAEVRMTETDAFEAYRRATIAYSAARRAHSHAAKCAHVALRACEKAKIAKACAESDLAHTLCGHCVCD